MPPLNSRLSLTHNPKRISSGAAAKAPCHHQEHFQTALPCRVSIRSLGRTGCKRSATPCCLLASVYQLLLVYSTVHCHASAHRPLMAVFLPASSCFGQCCEVSCSDMTLRFSNPRSCSSLCSFSILLHAWYVALHAPSEVFWDSVIGF